MRHQTSEAATPLPASRCSASLTIRRGSIADFQDNLAKLINVPGVGVNILMKMVAQSSISLGANTQPSKEDLVQLISEKFFDPETEP